MRLIPKLDMRRLATSVSTAVGFSLPTNSTKQLIANEAAPSNTWRTHADPEVARARRSIRASGLWHTAQGHQYTEALRAHRTEVQTYFAFLLRGYERVPNTFVMLEESLEQGHARELAHAPGARARLLALARKIVVMENAMDDVQTGSVHAPWEPGLRGMPVGYGPMLERMRLAVSELELETLFLRQLKLEDHEVAFVLDESCEDTEQRTKSSLAWISVQLRDEPLARGRQTTEVLADALLLMPGALPTTDAHSTPPPLPASCVIGERYEIERAIGGGAFGHVYRARDRRVHAHVVALKIAHRPSLSEAAREGALAELSRIASAFHPSLVQLKEYGWFEGRLWFAMPFYEGETLSERISRAPLSVREAGALLAPIARSLAALHAAGVRHQDVKPENIFLAKLGETDLLPVLLDLGVAVRSDETSVGGTPMYFAPEVARRFVDKDADVALTDRADVFALAMTFSHCIVPPSPEDIDPDFDAFMASRSSGTPCLTALPISRKIRSQLAVWMSEEALARPTAIELAIALDTLALPPTTSRMRTAFQVTVVLALAASAGSLWLGRAQISLPHAAAATQPPPVASLVERSALRERLDAAEARASALEERLSNSAH